MQNQRMETKRGHKRNQGEGMRMMSRGEEARLWFKELVMHRDEDEENNGTKNKTKEEGKV